MKISNLPDRDVKVIIIKMFNKLGKIMIEYSANFNKELENIKKQGELKNTIPEIKIHQKESTVDQMIRRTDTQTGRQNSGNHYS